MKKITALLVVLTISTHAFSATISERAAAAEEIEKQETAKDYLYKEFFPAIGSNMQKAMQECASTPVKESIKFTVVADITKSGAVTNVNFEPESNAIASCFAEALSHLKGPAPTLCEGELLPISIKMQVNP